MTRLQLAAICAATMVTFVFQTGCEEVEPNFSERENVLPPKPIEAVMSEVVPSADEAGTPEPVEVPSLASENVTVPEGAPNVYLIVVDTLRYDHVEPYGSDHPSTPFLKELSARGVLFERAYATSSWTVPSMYSIITGLYPTEHGVNRGGVGNGGVVGQPALSQQALTLVERLDRAGYKTHGVCTNHHLHQRFGFAQGFDHFVGSGFLKLPFPEMAVEAFEKPAKRAPSFYWLHYFDPHFPYRDNQPWFTRWNTSGFADWESLSLDASSRIYRDRHHLSAEAPIPLADITRVHRRGRVMALSHPRELLKVAGRAGPTVEKSYLDFMKIAYASEVARVDESIRKMFETLKIGKKDLVIITSDHGEEFLDHGSIGHRWLGSLHEELVRVPLIVLLPGRERGGEVVAEPVSLVDILPTVEDVLGLGGEPGTHSGTSLITTMNGGGTRRAIYGELDEPSAKVRYRLEYPWKYIRDFSRSNEKLYNLEEDPGETRDLAGNRTARVSQMRDGLDKWMDGVGLRWSKVETIPLSSQELERLRAMGYVL